MKTQNAVSVLFLAGALLVAPSAAALTEFPHRTSFVAQGTIIYNYGFEDIPRGEDGLGSPPEAPWNTHGLIYTEPSQCVVGPEWFPVAPVSAFLCNYALVADVEAGLSVNMLGFDVGYVGDEGPISVTIYTTSATYSYPDVCLAHMSLGGSFGGFVFGPAEFLTGFRIDGIGRGMPGYRVAGLDNVTLGLAIPEPATAGLLVVGAVGLVLRRCRNGG